MKKNKIFKRAGVNPQSMDKDTSGDAVIVAPAPNSQGQYLIAIADGAWVKGFEKGGVVEDIAEWSSRTLGDELFEAFRAGGNLAGMVKVALPSYLRKVEKLRRDVEYAVTPPAAFKDIDVNKVGPQSAFAALLLQPNGDLEIAQVRDCLVVFEYRNGDMVRQTPNQSEIIEEVSAFLEMQHESLGAYQALAREIIMNGAWVERHGEVAEIARKTHKPKFYELWLADAARLPDDLHGAEGFALWNGTFDSLCLYQNSWYFLNRPYAEVVETLSSRFISSWGMFNGEDTMLPLTCFRTLPAASLKDVTALWLMTDGAFKQGDKGEDLKALRELGPEAYYEEILMPRFEGKRFAPDRVPMDVTIIRVAL